MRECPATQEGTDEATEPADAPHTDQAYMVLWDVHTHPSTLTVSFGSGECGRQVRRTQEPQDTFQDATDLCEYLALLFFVKHRQLQGTVPRLTTGNIR